MTCACSNNSGSCGCTPGGGCGCSCNNVTLIELANKIKVLEQRQVKSQVISATQHFHPVSSDIWTVVEGTQTVLNIQYPTNLNVFTHFHSISDGTMSVDVAPFISGKQVDLGTSNYPWPIGTSISNCVQYTNGVAMGVEVLQPGTYNFDVRKRVRTPTGKPASYKQHFDSNLDLFIRHDLNVDLQSLIEFFSSNRDFSVFKQFLVEYRFLIQDFQSICNQSTSSIFNYTLYAGSLDIIRYMESTFKPNQMFGITYLKSAIRSNNLDIVKYIYNFVKITNTTFNIISDLIICAIDQISSTTSAKTNRISFESEEELDILKFLIKSFHPNLFDSANYKASLQFNNLNILKLSFSSYLLQIRSSFNLNNILNGCRSVAEAKYILEESGLSRGYDLSDNIFKLDDFDILKFIVEHHPSFLNPQKSTLVDHAALKLRNLDMVKFLVERKYLASSVALLSTPEITQYLLACPSLKFRFEFLTYDISASLESLKMILPLESSRPDINPSILTVDYHSYFGRVDIIDYLLTEGNSKQFTSQAIKAAAMAGYINTCKILLLKYPEYQIDKNMDSINFNFSQTPSNGPSFLEFMIQNNRLETIEFLLATYHPKSDPLSPNLIKAAFEHGRLEVIQVLHDNSVGIDFDRPDLILMAIKYHRFDILEHFYTEKPVKKLIFPSYQEMAEILDGIVKSFSFKMLKYLFKRGFLDSKFVLKENLLKWLNSLACLEIFMQQLPTPQEKTYFFYKILLNHGASSDYFVNLPDPDRIISFIINFFTIYPKFSFHSNYDYNLFKSINHYDTSKSGSRVK
eukprot:gene12278-15013_t